MTNIFRVLLAWNGSEMKWLKIGIGPRGLAVKNCSFMILFAPFFQVSHHFCPFAAMRLAGDIQYHAISSNERGWKEAGTIAFRATQSALQSQPFTPLSNVKTRIIWTKIKYIHDIIAFFSGFASFLSICCHASRWWHSISCYFEQWKRLKRGMNGCY